MKLKKIYRFFYNPFGVNKKDNPLLMVARRGLVSLVEIRQVKSGVKSDCIYIVCKSKS
jgi:hypothetical protein